MLLQAPDTLDYTSFDNTQPPYNVRRFFTAEAQKPVQGKWHFRTAIISDLHLGRGAAFAEYLLEFFQNIHFEKLILNGDIFDGINWMHNHHQDLPELHKRCVDAMFAFMSRGGELIYVPGNHDEEAGTENRIVFSGRGGQSGCEMIVCERHIHTDAQGRKILVLHGHQEDKWHIKPFWKAIADKADIIYEPLLELSQVFRRCANNWLDLDILPVRPLKYGIKKALGIDKKVRAFARKACESVSAYMAVCGHTHGAEFDPANQYANCGNWVENGNFLAETATGEWRLLHWDSVRKEIGLKTLPRESDFNRNAAYRGFTNEMSDMFYRLYPKKTQPIFIPEPAYA